MEFLKSLYTHPAWAAGLAVAGYGLVLIVYRLCFSPIAHFPGPKLAAMTMWYEIYYEVVLQGQYTFEIAKMHQKYGLLPSIFFFRSMRVKTVKQMHGRQTLTC
jgi:hypothetical protein